MFSPNLLKFQWLPTILPVKPMNVICWFPTAATANWNHWLPSLLLVLCPPHACPPRFFIIDLSNIMFHLMWSLSLQLNPITCVFRLHNVITIQTTDPLTSIIVTTCTLPLTATLWILSVKKYIGSVRVAQNHALSSHITCNPNFVGINCTVPTSESLTSSISHSYRRAHDNFTNTNWDHWLQKKLSVSSFCAQPRGLCSMLPYINQHCFLLGLMSFLSCLATSIGAGDHLTPPSLWEAHLFSQHPTSADQSSLILHKHSIPNKFF